MKDLAPAPVAALRLTPANNALTKSRRQPCEGETGGGKHDFARKRSTPPCSGSMGPIPSTTAASSSADPEFVRYEGVFAWRSETAGGEGVRDELGEQGVDGAGEAAQR